MHIYTRTISFVTWHHTRRQTSTDVLWITNCRHALGGLAGRRRTLLDMQERAAGKRHGRGRHEIMTSFQKIRLR